MQYLPRMGEDSADVGDIPVCNASCFRIDCEWLLAVIKIHAAMAGSNKGILLLVVSGCWQLAQG